MCRNTEKSSELRFKMRYTKDWQDYELLDCSEGERLERWGKVILIRPDPQVIWSTPKEHPMW